jgi:predicted RNase H-like nuclease (RuvC/YqgF family)
VASAMIPHSLYGKAVQERQELEEQVEQLRGQNANQRTTIQNQIDRIIELTRAKQDLEKQRADKNEVIAGLEVSLAQAQKQVSELGHKLSIIEENNKRQEDRIQAQVRASDAWARKTYTLEDEKKSLEEKVLDLQQRATHVALAKDEIVTEYARSTNWLRMDNKNLRAKIEGLQARVYELAVSDARVDTLQAMLSDKSATIRQLQDEVDHWRSTAQLFAKDADKVAPPTDGWVGTIEGATVHVYHHHE